MLKKSYNYGVVGLNYVSLIYGIISLKNKKNTLIIDDNSLSFANKWYLNIGYLERNVLNHLGEKYKIECLINIDNFLNEKSTILYLNEKLVELSSSPYTNIKEIARKFPECFSEVYQKRLMQCDQGVFDQDFFDFIDKISMSSFELFLDKKLDTVFDDSDNLELNDVITSFLNFLEKDQLVTKQLHYVLQVMFQTVFSSGKNKLETKYLLISLIFPRYDIDFKSLQEELMFEYRKLGGDIRESAIKDWGVRDGTLEYILLDVIDGMIRVDETFYFGQTSDLLPFKSLKKGTKFQSISLSSYVDHEFVDQLKNKRIVFSQEKRMGSDFPYWELMINESGLLVGVYSFADYLGTKPSFYYHHALEDLFKSLEMMLPGLIKADWIARAKMKKGKDIWFEYDPEIKESLHPHSKHSLTSLYDKESGAELKQIYHCGPNRAKSLGLYSYLLDIFSI